MNLFSKIPLTVRKRLYTLAELMLPVITIAGCFFMLEYSVVASTKSIWAHFAGFSARNILLNLLTLAAVWAGILVFSNRIWLSCLLTSGIAGILAAVNYYVIRFHGMPLSFLLIKNAKTAMNVISSYQISINIYIVKILLIAAVLTGFSLLLRRYSKHPKRSAKQILLRDALLLLFCFWTFHWGYFSGTPVKPVNTITWSWQEAYYQYGYIPCTMETFFRSINTVTRPDGYSHDRIGQIPLPQTGSDGAESRPDIILVLNESFYDLRQITDLQADNPFLNHIEGMENTLSGYAVVPNSGGGTNVSEYELLTSNSMQLMPGVTPFNTLDLSGANSIVSHLENLGYYTAAAHCMTGSNYSRSVGYEALGFDAYYFENDFYIWENLPGRVYNSDRSCYENVISWYELMPEEQPRFVYLLTIQNHGDWDHCPDENDRIHAQTDYGELDSIVDEYLTCMDYSDEAFLSFTEYFSTTERPVIICMLGDHSPSFAPSIADPALSSDEQALLLRSVPMVIWANFALEEQDLGTVSMNYVVPMLLDAANVERSPYYDYMLNMKQYVPVVSSFGKYYDSDGTQYDYKTDDSAPFENLVNDYFFLEYHNIQADTNRDLYQPYPG